MKVVIDIFGGDFAPFEQIKGACMALEGNKELEVALCGKQDVINEELKKYKYDKNRVEVIHASDVISMEDSPTTAIKTKTDSSLVVALDALKKRDDLKAFVSCGSTGAVLAGGLFRVGRIKGVSRPALAASLPTLKDGNVILMDCGANVDCKPQYICQFAVMGASYISAMFGVKNPKVALLSNGTEDKKGNDLNKQAFAMLKEMKNINFVGNVEGRDIMQGDVDVVVSDGFAGNVALKTMEGTAKAVSSILKREVMKSFKAKIGALFMKKALKAMKNTLDYSKKGGAPFLGIEKIMVKSHGSSDAVAVCSSIIQAHTMAKNNMIESIQEEMKKFEEEEV